MCALRARSGTKRFKSRANDVGYTIAEQAATFGVERVIIGAEQRSRLEYVLKGSVMKALSSLLPEEVQLVIYGG